MKPNEQLPSPIRDQGSLCESYEFRPCQIPILASQKLHLDKPHLNMAFTFVIEGPLEETYFQQAWQQMLSSHEALRSSLEFDKETITLSSTHPPLEIIDLGTLSLLPNTLKNWAEERSKRIFPLSERFYDSALIRLSPTHFAWYLNIHHLATDAITLAQIVKQTGDYYQALRTKKAKPEPQKSFYYSHHKSRSETISSQSEYWSSRRIKSHRIVPFPERKNNDFSTAHQRATITLTTEQTLFFTANESPRRKPSSLVLAITVSPRGPLRDCCGKP